MLAKKCFLVGIFILFSLSLAISAQPVHPTTGEPLMIDCLRGTVTIDGDLSDWNLEAMTPAVLDAVEQLSSGQDIWENVGDCGGAFYMLWDDVNIYIAAVVTDDKLSMNKTDGDIWNADCVEVLFSTTDAVADHSWANPTIHYQYGFNANNQKWNWCSMDVGGSIEPDYLQIASSVTADGYILEASIEYGQMSSLDFSAGNTIGFHPCIDDTDIDDGDTEFQMSWLGLPAHDQSQGFGHMLLSADSVSVPVPEPVDPGTEGLVAFYALDGDPNDSSGNGNDGTLFGDQLEWVEGKAGSALSHGGLSDAGVEIPTAGMSATAGTVAMWGLLTDPQPAQTKYFFGHTTQPEWSNRVQLYMNDGDNLLDLGLGDSHNRQNDIVELPMEEWLHVALTWDAGDYVVYLNGENVATGTYTGMSDVNEVANIGNDGSRAPYEAFAGLLDEVAIYSRALSTGEVRYLAGFRPPDDVTAPGDVVKGVPDELRDGSVAGWPDGEYPGLAVDDDVSTKFLHFRGEVSPTGFVVEPASGPSVVTGLTFTTANDAEPRDPISFELSGSNDSIDGPYELIASGDIVDFGGADAWPRFTMNATPISFENDVAYKYYQIMFPTVRDPGSANSMQIAEVELLGVSSPLVGHWTFDEGAGTVALDSSGNGNDGTLEDGPTVVEGQFGLALAFDGSRVTIPTSDSLTADLFQESFMVSGWINPTRTGNTWQQVFRSVTASATNDTLFLNNDGRLSWRGTVGGAWAGGMCETAPDVVPADQWTHFAVTGDGTNFRIYVNGALSQESAFQTTDGGNTTYYIGGDTNLGESYAGMVDDVRIYNLALSSAEVSELAGKAADPSLVIYYSFDEVGDIVADQSGNGHDGVVNGDVTAEAEGMYGGAANFANGGFLDLDGPSIPAEDIPTSAMTLAAWIKIANTGGDHEIFSARASDESWLIHPEPKSSGDIRWLLRSYGGTTIFQIRAGAVTWDEWLHFAGTYDKDSAKAALYINGELIEEMDVTDPADIAGDWGLGARVGKTIDDGRPYTGLMDEFRMYTRALSQDEILTIMQGM